MRLFAIETAVVAGLAALAAVPPAARAGGDFPLARLRDAVVGCVAAPSAAEISLRRLSVPAASRADAAPFRIGDSAARPIRLPDDAARSAWEKDAVRVPDGGNVRSRLALARPAPPGPGPTGLSALSVAAAAAPAGRPGRFAVAFPGCPPISRAPLDARRVLVLLGGLSAADADRIAATLAYEAMQEGSENPTDPKWRPSLAELVARPPRDIDADAVYQLLLAGFEGVDDNARMRLAEAWAARHDGGRYAGDIAYASLRAVFNAGDYRSVHGRAETVAAEHPDFAVRAKLLSVLADGYQLENARAKATLAALKESHADSPEYPEILYMEAWLALETFREGEAKAILHRILRDHPSSAAARKAAQILEAL